MAIFWFKSLEDGKDRKIGMISYFSKPETF